jgi:hypothetical protein
MKQFQCKTVANRCIDVRTLQQSVWDSCLCLCQNNHQKDWKTLKLSHFRSKTSNNKMTGTARRSLVAVRPVFNTLRMLGMNPALTFPPYFPKIHSNIIFPYTPASSEWSLPFRASDQNFVCTISQHRRPRLELHRRENKCGTWQYTSKQYM